MASLLLIYEVSRHLRITVMEYESRSSAKAEDKLSIGCEIPCEKAW
jgi:hypothetical protein